MSATRRAARPLKLSALPRAVELTLYAGDTFAMTLTLTGSDGEPYELAGALLRAQIRARPKDEEVIGEFNVFAIENKVVMLLDAAVSATLPERCAFDCELEETDRVLTLAAGPIRMRPEVTRDGS